VRWRRQQYSWPVAVAPLLLSGAALDSALEFEVVVAEVVGSARTIPLLVSDRGTLAFANFGSGSE
jgi:hypothetical protein